MAKPPLEIPGPLGASRQSRWLAGFRRRTHPTFALLGELVPRVLDIVTSALLLLLLSPLLVMLAFLSRRQSSSALTGITLAGRYQIPFRRLSFARKGRFSELAVWLNVFRGDMAIVGPRPLTANEGEFHLSFIELNLYLHYEKHTAYFLRFYYPDFMQ